MKLLLDQNLSRRLVDRLKDLYPEICHATAFGLEIASDEIIWDFALSNGHAIVTKDSDFSDLSSLRGSPPKVIWLRLGNCTTAEAEMALRSNFDAIEQWMSDPDLGILELQ